MAWVAELGSTADRSGSNGCAGGDLGGGFGFGAGARATGLLGPCGGAALAGEFFALGGASAGSSRADTFSGSRMASDAICDLCIPDAITAR